jgi:hypothetical protein
MTIQAASLYNLTLITTAVEKKSWRSSDKLVPCDNNSFCHNTNFNDMKRQLRDQHFQSHVCTYICAVDLKFRVQLHVILCVLPQECCLNFFHCQLCFSYVILIFSSNKYVKNVKRTQIKLFLISNFCRVANVVFFLGGDSPASE